MNTRKGKARFKNFRILLERGCSSTIVMVRLVKNIAPEKDAMIQWHTQGSNITTNIKVKVYFTLPKLSAKNVVTWKCHVDNSARGRYGMILGQDLFTELGLILKFSEQVIKADDGHFKGSITPVVNLVMYIFKDLNTGKITPE